MKAIPRSINVTDACSVASEISNIGAVPPMTRRNSSKMLQEELQAQQTVLNPNLNDDIYASYVREKERKKVLAERNAREHRKSRIKKENGAKSVSILNCILSTCIVSKRITHIGIIIAFPSRFLPSVANQ